MVAGVARAMRGTHYRPGEAILSGAVVGRLDGAAPTIRQGAPYDRAAFDVRPERAVPTGIT